MWSSGSEQDAAALMADGVADGDATAPIVVGVLVAVLKPLEAFAEQVADTVILQVDVEVDHVPEAVNERGHGKEKSGANHVSGLDAGVIVAVPEHGHFH